MSKLIRSACGEKSSLSIFESCREHVKVATGTPALGETTLLRGTIARYRSKRQVKDFLFTAADRKANGAASILAALSGQGGAAVAGLNAMNVREEADFVEFELNGEPVKGWITSSPFKDGDHVEILAVYGENGWNVLGILRDDLVMALHPCCSRGRYAHFKASVRWWLIIYAMVMTGGCVIVSLTLWAIEGATAAENLSFLASYIGVGGGCYLFFTGLVAANQSRKYMPSVRLAESIFAGFGWKNVKSIDLPAITKKYRLPGEGLAMGMLYFRCGKDSLDERLAGASKL